MAKVQVKTTIGILALVVVGGGAYALFAKRGDGTGEAGPKNGANVPSAQPLQEGQPVAPIVKLQSVAVPPVREYFASGGYTFEDKPLPGGVARAIGTWQDARTVIELAGLATLQQVTLHYKLRGPDLNGQDLHVIMYLMQLVSVPEADVGWAIDAARKGEPASRTIGAVVYAIQRGPDGGNDFVMRPAPGFE